MHYQDDLEKILKKVKELSKKNGLLIILDAYYDTEYIKILKLLREVNLDVIKLKKQQLDNSLIKEFGNIGKEVLFTQYKFPSIEELINNFKIELTLEESRVWTKDGEKKLREYLSGLKNPLVLQEGLWISKSIVNKSTKK